MTEGNGAVVAPVPPKETKAQRAERLKGALNPWAAYAEIERFAREGFDSIPPEWLNTYFRWWGLYTPGGRRGGGGRDGRRGQGRSATSCSAFASRTASSPRPSSAPSPTSPSVTRAGWPTSRCARISSSTGCRWRACPRSSRPCPAWASPPSAPAATSRAISRAARWPGVDADEIADASPLVDAATAMLNGAPEFYNLPRKFKVSIAGCRVWCSYPEINDVGLTAIRHPDTGETGFSLRVGGGLSTDPHLAPRLDVFVRWDQALAVFKAVAEIFRDSDVLREHREKARLKFLFLRHGWTAERFRAEIEARLGYRLAPAVPEAPPDDVYRDHVGAAPAAAAGSRLRGLRHPARAPESGHDAGGGRPRRALRLRRAAHHAHAEPRGSRRAARAGGRADRARRRPPGSPLSASPFRRGTVACTGTEFCKIALTETKGFARAPGRGAGGAPAGLRPAREDPRDGLPEFLRPALDRRHRARGQEGEGPGRARGRVLRLRGRRAGPARVGGAPGGLPRARPRDARGARAPAARVPGPPRARPELPGLRGRAAATTTCGRSLRAGRSGPSPVTPRGRHPSPPRMDGDP